MAKLPIHTKKGLGRGLDALLSGNTPENTTDVDSGKVPKILSNEIDLNLIVTNPFQPRAYFDQKALEELAESIRVQGIIQPITLRKIDDGKFELISGERRFQASKLAGLKRIPAYIREADDQQMLEMALVENIQRENLNAIEIALSYKRLMEECNLKQEQLGERVGKERSTVTNYLRLLQLPEEIQLGLKEKQISMGHARALLGLNSGREMVKMFNKIVTDSLSVRKVEELVKNAGIVKPLKGLKKINNTNYAYPDVEKKLSGVFETKVLIKTDDKSKGEIKISFESKEQFDLILEKLHK